MTAALLDRLRTEGGWFAVTEIARFALTGADRVRYLNGQVSNDVRRLQPGDPAISACVLSARGKLDAVVWIWAEPDRLVVETDAALADQLSARLERYIVADDVTLEPLPLAPTVHVFGPSAVGLPGRRIARLRTAGVDVESAPDGLPEAGAPALERLRIERLIPRWGAELTPDTLPAEAGLEDTAVDFHKGCYLGQEVVSRVRSVGHANRALRAFTLVDGPVPAPGAEFFLPGGTGKPAAVVTSVDFTLSPCIGLCYIRRGTSDGAVLGAADDSAHIHLRPPACIEPS